MRQLAPFLRLMLLSLLLILASACTSGNDGFDQATYDLDQDGIPNEIDDDIDGDGIPNAEDPDDDNDGIDDDLDTDDNANGIDDDRECAGSDDDAADDAADRAGHDGDDSEDHHRDESRPHLCTPAAGPGADQGDTPVP
ncbi:MAG: hypothetical protein H6707_12525 [Deltaproteobacteria bacterium]|nr:hypothetical protein [Deltaproteobacteria bacterium]